MISDCANTCCTDTCRRRHSPVLLLAALAGLLAAPPTAAGQQTDGTAETGRVQGQVVDAEDGSPVGSARVRIEGTEIGTLTDLNGRYRLREVPAGTHELTVGSLGYGRKTVTGVTVGAGEATQLDVTLAPEAVQVADLTVSVERERGSAAALLDEQRRSLAVSDAVGEQDISDLPASNAAESARQITGVTLSEGKYVFVRGLGERYSQTTLNGSPLPSPDPERSVVPLDLFPAGFLQSVRIQKTYTPDREADFSGGTVEIRTREYPERFTAKLSVGSSLNTRSQFRDDYLRSGGGSLDFLGIDDGSRGLPRAVEQELGGLDGGRLPSDPGTVERMGESMLDGDLSRFSPSNGSTPNNMDWSFALGDGTQVFGDDFGYFVAGSYSSNHTLRTDEVERKWRTTAFDPELVADREVQPNVNYEYSRGTRDVEWGGIANATYQPHPDHELTLKTLYDRHASDEARTYLGANREDLGGVLRNERLRFVARDMGWGQLEGEHRLPGGVRVEWAGAASRANRREPGLREAIYKRGFNRDEEPFVLQNTGESARYLFSDLTEDDLSGRLDVTVPFALPLADRDAELQLGGSVRERGRDFAARRFRWRFSQGAGITSLDSALSRESVSGRLESPGDMALTELREPGDTYRAEDDRRGGYGMLTLPLSERLTATLGARLESYSLTLSGRSDENSPGEEETLSDQDRTDVFPALNLKYAVTDAMNVRAAASRTANRPAFRELAPFQFTEAASLRQVYGNPGLEPAEIRSLDVRWEWFPAAGEALTLSGFYKELDRPIEQVFVATAGEAYSYQNAENGRLFGAEAGARKRLGLLHPGGPGGLTLSGNLALIDSRVNVRTGGIFDPTRPERPLEGQADYAASLGVIYRSPGRDTKAGVYFSVSGDEVTAAGGANQPDIVKRPRPDLDVTLEQSLAPRLAVELEATNVLDSPHLWEQSMNGITRMQRRYTTGRTFSLSFQYGR